MTKQSFRDETNINRIMQRYEKTGIIDHVRDNPGQYGDFSNVHTYQESLNMIMLAQEMFDSLPAIVRKTFDNDPVKFVEFAQDPDNDDQMREMGLLDPLPSPPLPSQPSNEDRPLVAPEKGQKTRESTAKTPKNTPKEDFDPSD